MNVKDYNNALIALCTKVYHVSETLAKNKNSVEVSKVYKLYEEVLDSLNRNSKGKKAVFSTEISDYDYIMPIFSKDVTLYRAIRVKQIDNRAELTIYSVRGKLIKIILGRKSGKYTVSVEEGNYQRILGETIVREKVKKSNILGTKIG